MPDRAEVLVRPYRAADRAAVRGICVATAWHGRPINALLPADLVADALIAPYIAWAPELLLVAERDGTVIGYAAGCRDTRTWWRSLDRAGPLLLRRALRTQLWRWPRGLAALASEAPASRRQRSALAAIACAFPAHGHINLAAGQRSGGAGTLLWSALEDRLRGERVGAMHVTGTTMGGRRFFSAKGFRQIARFPAPLSAGVTHGWVMAKEFAAAAEPRTCTTSDNSPGSCASGPLRRIAPS